MKVLMWLIVFSTMATLSAWAAPTTMRFQGRLTDSQGRPIVGNPQVRFEIFNAATGGALVWGPSSYLGVTSNEAGLFSVDIDLGVNGASTFAAPNDLFLQVTVKAGTGGQDQILSPRQHLSNVPYAYYSQIASSATVAGTANAIIDGAISTSKIQDSSISASKIQNGSIGSIQIADQSIGSVDLSTAVKSQFIPSGMIALFARACPEDWTRFDALDNRFPMGLSNYSGIPGGSGVISGLTVQESGNHSHTVNAHTHGSGTIRTTGGVFSMPVARLSPGGVDIGIDGETAPTSPPTNATGEHTHPITSDGSWKPPYLGVVFCEKD
ncbi:MAG: hypothetical protein KCHDKBKB_02151 [Elusimicrobia bacterium]|nr:hypothetical protein [Elusimicrobiota bacterium]